MRRADKPYHLHVPIVMKSGSLNLLEPSGPVQACNGIALPITTKLYSYNLKRSGNVKNTVYQMVNAPELCGSEMGIRQVICGWSYASLFHKMWGTILKSLHTAIQDNLYSTA